MRTRFTLTSRVAATGWLHAAPTLRWCSSNTVPIPPPPPSVPPPLSELFGRKGDRDREVEQRRPLALNTEILHGPNDRKAEDSVPVADSNRTVNSGTSTTNTPPKRPPPPSTLFGSMGENDWTDENWTTALKAANAFPDEEDRNLLTYICGRKQRKDFISIYKTKFDALPATNLTPTEYLERFIEQNKDKFITVWDEGKRVSRFFVSTDTKYTYKNRVIFDDDEKWTKFAMVPLGVTSSPFRRDDPMLLPRGELQETILYILSGESGSGKTTWALMTSDYGIYLTAVDFSPEDLHLIESKFGSEDDREEKLNIAERRVVEAALKAILEPTVGKTKDELVQEHLKALDEKSYTLTYPEVARALRNYLVEAALKQAVQTVVKNDFPNISKSKQPLRISLVVDELGSYPTFVRGLCAVQKAVRASIKAHFGALFPFDVTIKMIVVGTGTDVQTKNIGSLPGTYQALRMPSMNIAMKEDMLEEVAKPMKDMIKYVLDMTCGSKHTVLLSALDTHVQAQHLLCNPRFAACLLSLLLDYCNMRRRGELFATTEEALMSLNLQLTASAREYKLLNGMADCALKDVQRHYECALKLLHRRPEDQQKPTSNDLDLLRKKGVLTDCGMWVERGVAKELVATNKTHVEVRRDKASEFNIQDDSKSEEVVFVVPKTGRYRMSMAQQLLFRMNYGYHVLETAASWQRYEVVVADYVSMLLCGIEGQTLRDLLQRLGMKGPGARRKFEFLKKPLSFSRVVTIRSKKRITPTAADETVSKLCEECQITLDTAAVIVNGAGAPYADVIVVVPGVAAILIQCKFYGESSAIDVPKEAKKLEAKIGVLEERLNVPNDAYFRVLATTKDLGTTDLHGFYLFNTSSETSLQPLFTPIHMASTASVSDEKNSEVIRDIKLQYRNPNETESTQ